MPCESWLLQLHWTACMALAWLALLVRASPCDQAPLALGFSWPKPGGVRCIVRNGRCVVRAMTMSAATAGGMPALAPILARMACLPRLCLGQGQHRQDRQDT
jgi:hypothetical protein